jgi:hypothetical protein
MKKIHKIEVYLPAEDALADYSVGHRQRYGEAPVIGMSLENLVRTWKRTGMPKVSGGKGTPVTFDLLTFAGVTTLFEDPECGTNEFSADEPDE